MEVVKTCAESRVIQTRLILPGDTNSHKTLYGGRLLEIIDNTCGISFIRHTRQAGVTASIDGMNFIEPLPEGHSVCVEVIVSGVGTRSVELFAKAVGENLATGHRFLAATAFLTFVAMGNAQGELLPIPQIKPESEEEIFVCSGYEDRVLKRKQQRQEDMAFNDHISKDILWVNANNQ